MTDAERILQRLDDLERRQSEIEALVKLLGCADPKNQEADKLWREIVAGAIAVSRLVSILGAIGRFALMVGGMVTVAAALLNGWKGGP